MEEEKQTVIREGKHQMRHQISQLKTLLGLLGQAAAQLLVHRVGGL